MVRNDKVNIGMSHMFLGPSLEPSTRLHINSGLDLIEISGEENFFGLRK